jgi:hypothetical protein
MNDASSDAIEILRRVFNGQYQVVDDMVIVVGSAFCPRQQGVVLLSVF